MDEIYNKIESIAAESNGFVKTSQIEAAGISRGPQGENISRLLRDNQKIKAHYVMKGFYDLGITETRSPQGAIIRLYVQAIKDYFKNRPDVRKLLKYGKAFGIEEKMRTYMEVL